MARLGDITTKIRSKNAGPFWLTVDVFCGSATTFEQLQSGLSTNQIAAIFGIPPTLINRYEIPTLQVIKFSLPRPATQGAINDHDIHGASWAALVQEISV